MFVHIRKTTVSRKRSSKYIQDAQKAISRMFLFKFLYIILCFFPNLYFRRIDCWKTQEKRNENKILHRFQVWDKMDKTIVKYFICFPVDNIDDAFLFIVTLFAF